jgi:hypothetical protein
VKIGKMKIKGRNKRKKIAFIMCSKFSPLVVFSLDLMSAYEGKHTIFGLLGQANLTQNDVLQFHPFTCK